MDMIQNKSVINLNRGEIDMWEKYRHESKQTICVIGVLILAAKLCKRMDILMFMKKKQY